MIDYDIREFISKLMIILSISILCGMLCYAYIKAYRLANIFTTDKVYEDATIETIEDYTIFNGEQAETNIDEINACLDDIPVYMKSFLIDKGWKIEYVDYIGISTKEFGEARTVGETNSYDKTIQIDIIRAGKQVLYHELGHILDMYGRLDTKLEALGVYEDSDEWKDITLKSKFWEDYINSDYDERKAEVYYTFVFYPEELKEQAPNIYQAYDNAYNSLHSSNIALTSIELYITSFNNSIADMFS